MQLWVLICMEVVDRLAQWMCLGFQRLSSLCASLWFSIQYFGLCCCLEKSFMLRVGAAQPACFELIDNYALIVCLHLCFFQLFYSLIGILMIKICFRCAGEQSMGTLCIGRQSCRIVMQPNPSAWAHTLRLLCFTRWFQNFIWGMYGLIHLLLGVY